MTPRFFLATKAFIVKDGKVLVIRESAKYDVGTKVGKYDNPGGRLQPGEHHDEALRREVEEETGLDIKINKPIFVNESWPEVKGEQWQIVRIFFECEVTGGTLKLSDDHDDVKWIDPKNYKNETIIENLYPVFEAWLKLQ
ncbi:MAG: NUDIX hydrolase [Candidatus Woesearchaeota archaeon]